MSALARDVLTKAAALVDDDLEVVDPEETAVAIARVLRMASESAAHVSGSRLAEMLGTSRQAVQQRAARGRLLSVADESGVRYPLWQLRDGRPLAGLVSVVTEAHARGLSDSALVEWFEARPERIDQLQAGGAAELVAALPSARVTARRHQRVRRQRESLSD